jgi:hypothetical protein
MPLMVGDLKQWLVRATASKWSLQPFVFKGAFGAKKGRYFV